MDHRRITRNLSSWIMRITHGLRSRYATFYVLVQQGNESVRPKVFVDFGCFIFENGADHRELGRGQERSTRQQTIETSVLLNTRQTLTWTFFQPSELTPSVSLRRA